MDLNKALLSGLAISDPIRIQLSERTELAYFDFLNNEHYTDSEGKVKTRPNYFRVEGVGRGAAHIMDKVRAGRRYYVDGYLRHDHKDGMDYVKVRAFSVYKDLGSSTSTLSDALKEAIKVVQRSASVGDAVATLKNMIE